MIEILIEVVSGWGIVAVLWLLVFWGMLGIIRRHQEMKAMEVEHALGSPPSSLSVGDVNFNAMRGIRVQSLESWHVRVWCVVSLVPRYLFTGEIRF